MMNTWMIGDLSAAHLARLCVGGDAANHPVEVVSGHQPPRWAGEGYYWTTPSGKIRFDHPNAYGWPTVYHASTLHVEVGAGWLVRQARRGWREDDRDGVRCYVACGSRRWVHGWRAERGRSASGRRIYLVVAPDGWAYHAPRDRDTTPRQAVRAAISARTEQRKADRAWLRGLGRPLCDVVVTREHALAAGACLPGVESWCRRAGISTDGAERADDLLTAAMALGEVGYVRRAIACAARA